MNQYMIAVTENEGATAAEQARLIEARAAFTAQLKKSGAFLDAERLRGSSESRRVQSVDGKVQVRSGPFEDALGSYWSVQVKDLEAALELAKMLPVLQGDRVGVRPIMKGEYEPAKADKTGKVFAVAVLGSAPNEEAWIRLMNRIDDETNDRPSESFPDAFIAGVRLESPRTGRRLVTQHGKTVVLDGPFLESKEVIGGLFFMRLPSLEDAIAWVSKTPFITIGSAEIREVWRS